MGLLVKIKNALFNKKTENEINEEPVRKSTTFSLGHPNYSDILIEAMCCPTNQDYEEESHEEIKRLKKIAIKTKSKRIKKKLNKRIEKEAIK